MASGEYTRLIDADINIFGLSQYDGLTQFFAEGTYALPQVNHRNMCCLTYQSRPPV